MIELDVEEIGPSLRYARATVTRTDGSRQSKGQDDGEDTYRPVGIDLDMGMMDVPEATERESCIVRSLLRDAVRNTEPKLVFSGHWHQRSTGLMPGMETRVHVLNMEHRAGNVVSLDLATLAVEEYKPV